MSEKNGNFFEEHIEKLVLAIVGLVCMWLLISRVLISPNTVRYDDKKFTVSAIDNYMNDQAGLLGDKLNRKPDAVHPYKPQIVLYESIVDNGLLTIEKDNSNNQWRIVDKQLSVNLALLQPNNSKELGIRPIYDLPAITEVNDVAVEHIRAVAYVPTGKVDEENVYDRDGSEVNDIDFVTVEAKFDAAGLVKNFYESFAGDDVQLQWRDPCLAEPVFAAVQLQRQEMSEDGSWSRWQVVPRTRIDARRQMLEVAEDVNGLPAGGIKVCLLKFDNGSVRADLLQPESYRIASAKEEWFPPLLHREYVKYQRQIDTQERRQARDKQKQEREDARAERGGRKESRTKSRSEEKSSGGNSTDMMAMMQMAWGGGGGGGGAASKKTEADRRKRAESRKKERQQRDRNKEQKTKESSKTSRDFYDELDTVLITDKTDLSSMTDALSFWAHDDTVEPGNSYRYRIRLGVFNPITGTNRFSEQCKSLRDSVILWSNFSDVTESVDIPERLYFFPCRIQEAAKTVTVTVCRYVLGYWYSEDFSVKPGEVIGGVAKFETDSEEDDVEVPETIDYSTGAVLVDAVSVNDWAGEKNLRQRVYFDMLYSFDGMEIEHRAIEPRNWVEKLQVKFGEIKRAEREPKEALREWGSKSDRRGREQTPESGDGGYDMEEYMRMMMQGMQ